MKPRFVFYFEDEPQYATTADRAWLANALRAYRKHKARYELRRCGLHRYTVRHGLAVATIQARAVA